MNFIKYIINYQVLYTYNNLLKDLKIILRIIRNIKFFK